MSKPEASPASRGPTPASAAIDTGMNAKERPKPNMTYPPSRSCTYVPSTGICAYQIRAPVLSASPATITGFGPILVESHCASPATSTTVPAVARNVIPVFSAE